MLDAALVRSLAARRVPVSDAEWLCGKSRASLHRVAKRAGFGLPPRECNTPTRDGWKALMVEHGLSVRALAKATGLRADYVRNVLLDHGLITTWWGWRSGRYAEWTCED